MTHLRLVPRDVSPTDRPRPPVATDRLPERLEDAAFAAEKCGQPVLLTPQVVREIAFLLRIGSVA